jgi:cytochrome c553
VTGDGLNRNRPGALGPGRARRMTPRERSQRASSACLLALALVLSGADRARAADPAAGREKAMQCQTCHGLDGVGRMPDVPNIAGESEMYLTKQLQDFRSGARRHEQMSIIAGALSDDDIADLAAYYASIEFTVKVPEF